MAKIISPLPSAMIFPMLSVTSRPRSSSRESATLARASSNDARAPIDRVAQSVFASRAQPTASSISCLPESGTVEIDIQPLGILSERLRSAGAGLGGVFLPTGIGTRFQQDKEKRLIDGKEYILEQPLNADFAFIKAQKADTLGNLIYRGSSRNWGPVMAMASSVCIAEVEEICEPGELDPEKIITQGIFVNRIIQTQ